MNIICKHPVADYGGNLLFLKDKEYKIESESAGKQVMIKDELGGMRWIPSDSKFFKEHFKKVKE